ncbi:MAG: aminotransferase class V-fold PLP-dependent enzyme [Bacteroidetes bacterium]|nr:aminotransferase class V-fold PLP-dependent enzyme [Bacteroidota bacterium]
MDTRRDFIRKTAVSAFGLSGLSISLQALNDPEHILAGAVIAEDVRRSLLLKEGLVYMNTGSLGPSPAWVSQRIFEITRILESNPVVQNWDMLGKEMEAVRAKVAAFLNCAIDEIVLTRNTTEGLSMVSSTLKLHAGDEILTTNHEHGGGETGLEYLAGVSGAKVVKLVIPMPAEGVEQVVDSVVSAITPQTRVLLLSHVTTITGLRMPLKQIAEAIRGRDIIFIADGAQAAGMIPVNVKDLGVDVYATSGHKWLMGPKETGMLYVNKDIRDKINPVFIASGYQSYSASSGTRNVAQIIAFGEVLDWHEKMGRCNVEKQCRDLCDYCYLQLGKIQGVKIISPSDLRLRSAMVSIDIEGDTPKSMVFESLRADDIIVKSLPKYNALRLSNHIFNTKEDVDKMIAGLKKYIR